MTLDSPEFASGEARAGAESAPGRLLRRLLPRALTGVALADAPAIVAEIHARQLAHFARQTPVYALGNIANAAMTAWVFWDRLPHGAVLLWFGLFATILTVRLGQWWRWRYGPSSREFGDTALAQGTLWSLIAGVFWGAAVVYAFPSEALQWQLFLTFVVGGMAAAAVASLPLQPVTCLAYTLPSMLPLVTLFALEGDPISLAMAAMLMLYLVVLLAALANGYAAFLDTVRTKVENLTLQSGLAQAALANRAKTEFLANMSHEIRTPLNAIIGFSEMISSEVLGPVGTSRYRDYANDIYDSGQHLLRIINDVLDMSKIGAGKLELHEHLVDVATAAQTSIALVTPRAVSAGVTLSAELPQNLPLLLADELRLKQILLNLLSNAVKFTRRPGSATVAATVRGDGSLAITVSDTGIGMTAAEIAIALEPFQQVDSDLARKYEGTGLGLPLTRALVELHGGRLEISSTPGQGTAVTVTFPAARVHPREKSPTETPAA